MTDDQYPDRGYGAIPSAGARRVPTSRAGKTPPSGKRRGGRRKAPQPGKTVARVILSSLLTLGLLTGVGVVLIYNNWNGNIQRKDISAQLTNRPDAVENDGPQAPLNILVMGSDTRSGKGNKIDGESGGGLSDTTILLHISGDRKFAYGISIPRDTAVMRPACIRADGKKIPAGGGYEKWNNAFAYGGPGCTQQQVEQLTGVRIDKYIVVDFSGFKDMVDALGGVEVCVPKTINDTKRNIYLKAGTREVKGNEALTYVRLRYRVGDGTDPNRTRRQQAFIGSMVNKALTAGILSRPDRLVDFINAATSSLTTDFDGIAQMASLAGTARGIGADNIKFITTPWVYSDKVSGGIEWTPEVDKLWRLVKNDLPLTPEFLKDSISAGDEPDGTVTAGGASGSAASPSGSASTSPSPSKSPSASPSSGGTANGSPSAGASGSAGTGSGVETQQGLSADGREAAGLCT